MMATMCRRTVLALVIAIALHAQSPASSSGIKFEVASIKPTPPGTAITGIQPAPGGQRYLATNVNLKFMIQTAYGVVADQVVGGPDWINRDRFDMDAKAERASTIEELHVMLQALLAERFQLAFRRQTKELPVYVLTVEKGGPSLTPHDPQNSGESVIYSTVTGPLHIKIDATAGSMDDLSLKIRRFIDRPVINKTGLKGGYDFSMFFTMSPPESMHEGMLGHDGKPIDFSGPTIFEALRKQIGLHLETGKAPLEIMLIDHVAKPGEN